MAVLWRDRAKCAGDWEFISRVAATCTKFRARAAREACCGCPVMRECARDCFVADKEGVLHVREREVPRAGVWILANPSPCTRVYQDLVAIAGLDA